MSEWILALLAAIAFFAAPVFVGFWLSIGWHEGKRFVDGRDISP